jgi:hypothetical protein
MSGQPPEPGALAVVEFPVAWRFIHRAFLIAVAAAVLGGFPAVVYYQSLGASRAFSWIEIAGFIGLGAVACGLLVQLPSTLTRPIALLLARAGGGLVAALLLGVLLRMASALAIQPEPFSDAASYLALAAQLATTHSYGEPGALAYWPPGLPLALAPLLLIGLPEQIAVLVLNLGSFVLTSLGVVALMRAVGAGRVAALPVWLLALWPTHVLLAGAPVKELQVIALLPWVALLSMRGFAGSWAAALGAGALTGLAVLVQPSLQLLPVGAVLLAMLAQKAVVRPLVFGAALVLGMLVVVAPWTLRNQAALGETVLVSTNGGSVLYRANNELATGTYMAAGPVVVSGLGEVATDRAYKRLGLDWISNNGAQFARLAATKVLLFLGDNSYGAYVAFSGPTQEIDRKVYLAIRLFCALPWLAAWALIAAWAGARRSEPATSSADGRLFNRLMLALPAAYLLAIHAVFESGTKYHLPLLGIVLVLVSMLAADRAGVCGPQPKAEAS